MTTVARQKWLYLNEYMIQDHKFTKEPTKDFLETNKSNGDAEFLNMLSKGGEPIMADFTVSPNKLNDKIVSENLNLYDKNVKTLTIKRA
jgi:hypothetical protein